MSLISVKCKQHPRYRGIYSPRTECRSCRVIYLIEMAPLGRADFERIAESYDALRVSKQETK
jgi:hypothetical protein